MDVSYKYNPILIAHEATWLQWSSFIAASDVYVSLCLQWQLNAIGFCRNRYKYAHSGRATAIIPLTSDETVVNSNVGDLYKHNYTLTLQKLSTTSPLVVLVSIQSLDCYKFTGSSSGYYLKVTSESNDQYTIWFPASSGSIKFYTFSRMLYSQSLYEASSHACIGCITTFFNTSSSSTSSFIQVTLPTYPHTTTTSNVKLFMFISHVSAIYSNSTCSNFWFRLFP